MADPLPPASQDRFKRIRLMVGDAGLERLRGSFAAVVGLGAVGSYAVEALARAGVGRLRLVDFDEVRASNINRQLFALESTLGRPKCEAAERRVRDINPSCRVEALRLFVDSQTVGAALEGPPDIVVDAIDSLQSKVELLLAAQALKVPLLSSMGAALRTDPTLIRVGPLSEVKGCPLAARVRSRLKRRGAVLEDIACVYSLEPAHRITRKASSCEDGLTDTLLERGLKRPAFGSLPTLTGIFGLVAANEVLRSLLGEHFPST
jgi:tRNA A37 threonylcarbamoyladenosine dehydratase